MLYFILSLLVIIQFFTLLKIISFREKEKKSEEIIERYKDATLVAKIPKHVNYNDIDPNYDTFYNFMENVKLENWQSELDVKQSGIDSCWDVELTSHDDKSKMRVRLRDYGDGVFLSTCTIRSGGTSLSIGKEDAIAKDVILFTWDYVIEYYEMRNKGLEYSFKDSINIINSQLKTLNRSKRLNNILDIKSNGN
jgi:hypothetical protein